MRKHKGLRKGLQKTAAILLSASMVVSFASFPALAAEPENNAESAPGAVESVIDEVQGQVDESVDVKDEASVSGESLPEIADDVKTDNDVSKKDNQKTTKPKSEKKAEKQTPAKIDKSGAVNLTVKLDDGTVFAVQGPAGSLPDNAKLKVSKTNLQKSAYAVFTAMGYDKLADSLDETDNLSKLIASYHISFINDGELVQPKNQLTVKVDNTPVDMYQFGGHNMDLWKLSEGKAEKISVSAADEGAVEFQTNESVDIAVTGEKAETTASSKKIRRAPSKDQREQNRTGVDWFDNISIPLRNYTKVEKTQVNVDDAGNAIADGTYNGTLTVKIPAKEMFGWLGSHLDDEIFGTKVKNFYPHGDGKGIIGGVVLEANLPAGTTIGDVKVDKGTDAFSKYTVHDGTYSIANEKSSGCTGDTYTNTLSYSGASNDRSIFLTFTDQNFGGIYNTYKLNPDAVVSLTIPYSYNVKKGDDVSGIGNATVQAQTWSHITGNQIPAYIYSDTFSAPVSSKKNGELTGDMLVDNSTEHDAVYVAGKNDTMTITGALNVSPIKDKLKEIQDNYQNGNAAQDILIQDGAETIFTAVMALPEGLEFTDNVKADLTGDNGKFKIANMNVEGRTITVTMSAAKDLKTFQDVLDTVNGAGDELQVNVAGVKFTEDAKPNVNYTMTGTLTGRFKATARSAQTGSEMNFNLTWSADQEDGKEDAINPGTKAITVTVKYPDQLLGDMLVNDDTEHKAVYTASKSDTMSITGALNVKPIKDQLSAIRNSYQNGKSPESILIQAGAQTTFTAVMRLPVGLEFTDQVKTVLTGDNGKFKITDTKVEGKTITVTMSATKDFKTFQDVLDTVNGAGDELQVNVTGVKFTAAAKANTNYTMTGTLKGSFKATAESATGREMNFDFDWSADQEEGKEDAIKLGTKDITATVKYVGLVGDMLVNNDTEHDAVYTANKSDTMTITGALNVTPIKEQLKQIQDQYQNGKAAADILIHDGAQTTFTAVMTLPNELEFTKDVKTELTGDNGNFKITDTKIEGKTVTVTMSAAKDFKTFQDVLDTVTGAGDELKVNVNGVKRI